MNINRALSMISLATKAGKTKSGEFMTEKEVKEGRAHLVIVADDASDNTKKKFQNMCDFYKVPIYFFEDKDTLGNAMGKRVPRFACSNRCRVCKRNQKTSGYGRRIIGTVYRR